MKFRLILDGARSAPLNMAVDEMLFNSLKPADQPILRIYSWDKPSYSIGYFQSLEAEKKKFNCEAKSIPMVRRITGGGLVFHDKDVTFSLIIQTDNPLVPREVKSSYLKINEALIAGFKEIHPKLDFADCKTVPSGRPGKDRVCFESPSCYDLMLSGKKVGGSSQRRKNGALLHQASLFLMDKPEAVTQKILQGFKSKWVVEFADQPLSEEEMRQARLIETERYSKEDWSFPLVFLASSFLSKQSGQL